ncbi:hypothetical protein [Actinospica robiniae]|uniref:hypothetical protein n=1 Tax=Actinospica robiniae TaxID=304901 RepID=UPI000409012F|nr:hypothetical protein [Actinospica robiniae]
MPSDEAATQQQDTDTGFPERPWQRISAAGRPAHHRRGLRNGLGALVGVAVVGVVAVLLSGGSGARTAAAPAPTLSAAPAASAVSTPSGSVATGDGEAGGTVQGAAADVAVPDVAGSLVRLTGPTADTVTSDMAKADAADETLAGAEFGAYATTGTSTYFSNLTLVPLNATLKQLEKAGPAAALESVVKNGLADSAAEPSAVTKGAMTCGMIEGGKVPLRACSWIDDYEYGLTAFPSTLTNDVAAQYSAALWTASEGSAKSSAISATATGF